MKKFLLPFVLTISILTSNYSQVCIPNAEITTADSILCLGDTTLLSFPAFTIDSMSQSTPVINNNGQDGNMFNITATNTIRIKHFMGNIANTPNATTQYYVYYKVGTHVGFENNGAAWTLIGGPVSFNPNAPNTFSYIPVDINITIPAGQTYAFYLTNTSAASNNNRYHTGVATGTVSATNADLTIYEGTGGAYPFGTFFNARPWEGTVIYDYPISYLWSTGDTISTIQVNPSITTNYSCVSSTPACTVEDTINVQVVGPIVSLGNDTSICNGSLLVLDAGNPGSTYAWCNAEITQTINVSSAGLQCVTVTDINGCDASDSIMVNTFTLPNVVANYTDSVICENETITFTGSGASTYLWNNSVVDGVPYSPSISDDYIVTGTDLNNCSNADTVSIIVNPLPVVNLGADIIQPSPPAILDAGSGFASYLWNTTEVTQTISVASNGNYFVTVTDANGCTGSDTILVVFVGAVSNPNGSLGEILIYPNPVEDVFQLQITNLEANEMVIEIMDIKGSLLQTMSSQIISGSLSTPINVETLAAGVYIINIKANGNQSTHRFIKK